jgi:hypothetical protein
MARKTGIPGARPNPGGGMAWLGRRSPNGPVKIFGPSPIINLEQLAKLEAKEVQQDIIPGQPAPAAPVHAKPELNYAKLIEGFFVPLNPTFVRNWDYSVNDLFQINLNGAFPQTYTIGEAVVAQQPGQASPFYEVPEGHVLVMTYLEFYALDSQFLDIPRDQLSSTVAFRLRSSATSGMGEFLSFTDDFFKNPTSLVGQTFQLGSVGPFGMPEFARFFTEHTLLIGEFTDFGIPPMQISRVGVRASGYLVGMGTLDAIRGSTQ